MTCPCRSATSAPCWGVISRIDSLGARVDALQDLVEAFDAAKYQTMWTGNDTRVVFSKPQYEFISLRVTVSAVGTFVIPNASGTYNTTSRGPVIEVDYNYVEYEISLNQYKSDERLTKIETVRA